MIIRPVFNILLLPDITYFFKRDFFPGAAADQIEVGTDILFPFLKNEVDETTVTIDDIYPVGMSARVESIGDDDSIQIRTLERVSLDDIELDENGQITATASIRPEVDDLPLEEEKQTFTNLRNSLLKFVQNYQWGIWARSYIIQRKNIYDLGSALSDYLNITSEEKYAIVETDSRRERCELIENAIKEFMEVAKVSSEAQEAQKGDQEQLYREAAIKKQIDYLQKELDEMHPENISDVRAFEKKIQESGMNEDARKEADKVLNRMKQEGKDSHEYGLLYDYLDFVTSLSWKHPEFTPIDLNRAEEILDEDHYGLKKVKERIIQQIAVMALNRKQYGSILLFVGAPGTGKTSIGQSIARALNREYVRISLGGIRDEAEIRGHRRTYIGAMPGRIMEGIKRSGVSNPVVVLDEVDKLAKDYGGDPASALLEVLDPEQNSRFMDHYIEVPQDLSEVLFIATANDVQGIPRPLLDRMELIEIAGYTENEKEHIAKEHLIPKQMEENGIEKGKLTIQSAALKKIINNYTKEAGVRNLERTIGQICRKTARLIMEEDKKKVTVTLKNLSDFLGKEHFNYLMANKKDEIGISRGLAWTQVGGDTLQIEVNVMPGKGELMLTGQLGDVMKESAQAGITYIRSIASDYKVEPEFFQENDIHVHIPEGAVPKDGPSAGITMATAILSAIIKKPVRADLAMTGEITLRGRVLPIGGLKEKLLAAKYAKIKEVLVPAENKPDIQELDKEITDGLTITFVSSMKEVLNKALV